MGLLRTLLPRENRKAFVKTVLIVFKLDVGRIKVLMILIIFLSCASKYLSTFLGYKGNIGEDVFGKVIYLIQSFYVRAQSGTYQRSCLQPIFDMVHLRKLGCTRFIANKRKVGWLVGCFGLNGPLRQYFSLYRAVSRREVERREK